MLAFRPSFKLYFKIIVLGLGEDDWGFSNVNFRRRCLPYLNLNNEFRKEVDQNPLVIRLKLLYLVWTIGKFVEGKIFISLFVPQT